MKLLQSLLVVTSIIHLKNERKIFFNLYSNIIELYIAILAYPTRWTDEIMIDVGVVGSKLTNPCMIMNSFGGHVE